MLSKEPLVMPLMNSNCSLVNCHHYCLYRYVPYRRFRALLQ